MLVTSRDAQCCLPLTSVKPCIHHHHHHHRDICNAPITVKKTNTSATYATLKYIKIEEKK